MRVRIFSFTQGGQMLANRILPHLADCQTEHIMRDGGQAKTSLRECVRQAFADNIDALVFIGAAGIAVRAIAPHLQSKATDPAVLVLDEAGRFVIPLLSGHLGGANALAARLSDVLGAAAVITTATDVQGVFAVDTWAKAQGYAVIEVQNIRYISAALLRGETVGLHSDFPVRGALPQGISTEMAADSGFVVSYDSTQIPFLHTLHLVPCTVTVGIGCRRGKSEAELMAVMQEVLDLAGIHPRAVCALASIDLKRDEAGLCALADTWGVPFVTFSAESLQEAAGDFTPSAFVQKTVQVDNVCERAAVCASRGVLLHRKYAKNGVTVALAATKQEVVF